MKLNKKNEAEILKTYNAFWAAYLKGNMRVMSSFMDKNIQVIGSGQGEVFKNKKETVKYYKATANQISGKSKMRNRKIILATIGNNILVTEEFDLYVLMNTNWTFYGEVRLSTLFAQEDDKWLIIQQHSSLPDARTGGGEQLNTDKIKEENLRLKDAVKRRTSELEHKNKELEIEAALERVRSSAMAMHNSNELLEVISIMSFQLKELNIKFDVASFGINNDNLGFDFWLASRNFTKPQKLHVPNINNNPIVSRVKKAQQNGVKFFADSCTKEEHREWIQILIDNNEISEENKLLFLNLPGFERSSVILKSINIYILKYNGIPFSDQENEIFIRFAKAFEQAYTRFLDLQKAETQAREVQIELALERVRARTMAMQKSDDLQETALILFEQVETLGIETFASGFNIWDADKKYVTGWMARKNQLQPPFKIQSSEDIYLPIYEAAQRGESLFVKEQGGEELEAHYAFLTTIPEVKEMAEAGLSFPTFQIIHCAFFSQGYLMFITYKPVPAAYDIFKRFAKVFEQTYTRFLDLQKVEVQARQAQIDLEHLKVAKKKTEVALVELKAIQSQLIQSEKMASLGELTAGIAHEIQNPLNFVNNFSEVSNELIDEMTEEIDNGDYKEVKEIASDIKLNLEKINHHGKRASSIVKGMLDHSRTGNGVKVLTDINILADEYLRLSYHGLRAKDKSFNADFKTDLDKTIPKVSIVPQDFSRVILNLINNAFYAVSIKGKEGLKGYQPTVTVSTKKIENTVEICVKDNGNGIPQKVLDKIFQPFFTTKPTGEGTGLGLSLSYDIVKAHGGEINVETKEGKGTTFNIRLPL